MKSVTSSRDRATYLALLILALPSSLKRLQRILEVKALRDQRGKLDQPALNKRDGELIVACAVSEGTSHEELLVDDVEQGDGDGHVAAHADLDVGAPVWLVLIVLCCSRRWTERICSATRSFGTEEAPSLAANRR